MEMETPNILRDCLQSILENGSSEKIAYYHAYLLAKEFKRVQYPIEKAIGEIEKWAGKCEPALTGSKLREINRTLQKVYEKNDPPLNCAENGCLKKMEYCFLKYKTDKSCEFNNSVQLIKEFLRNKKIQETGWDKWEKYLQIRYKTLWHYLTAFYTTLKTVELERGIPQNGKIFVGFRDIRNRIMARYKDYRPSTETLCLCSKILEEEKLIKVERVEHSKRGTFKRQANGYTRIVPLPETLRETPDYTHTMRDSQIMCTSLSNT